MLLSVDDWNDLAVAAATACWAIGVLIVLIYFIRLISIRESKDRYDFINRYEIRWLWIGSVLIISGGCFFGNSAVLEISFIWAIIRILVTLLLGTIVALVTQHLLKFYYPFYIEKRLKRLRYKPRMSPSGRPMRLLSEQEEDAYMDEGMLAEENIFSMDYDVWKDEESGFVSIEKYAGHLHALKCPECGCQTMKVSGEKVVKPPRDYDDGLLEKSYLCGYCQHSMSKTVRLRFISKLDAVTQSA